MTKILHIDLIYTNQQCQGMYIKRKSFIQWLEHEIYLLGLMSGATIQFLIGIIPQMSDCCITAISYKDVWKLPYLNICMGLGRQLQINIQCHYTLRRVWSMNHRVQEHKFTETQRLLSLGFKSELIIIVIIFIISKSTPFIYHAYYCHCGFTSCIFNDIHLTVPLIILVVHKAASLYTPKTFGHQSY